MTLPAHLWYIILGILLAVLVSRIETSERGNSIALGGLLVSVCLIGYGIYLFAGQQ
jgi:hypothetical protein